MKLRGMDSPPPVLEGFTGTVVDANGRVVMSLEVGTDSCELSSGVDASDILYRERINIIPRVYRCYRDR